MPSASRSPKSFSKQLISRFQKVALRAKRNEVLREFMQRNLQQGVSAEEFEKHKEQLHEGASKAAHDRLKARLILSKIAEKEKIVAAQEDFSRMIMMEAQRTGEKPEKIGQGNPERSRAHQRNAPRHRSWKDDGPAR